MSSEIIIKPLITEKTMGLSKQNRYTFLVALHSHKRAVKKAVEDFFKVKVEKVWLAKVVGKNKRVGKLRNKIRKKPSWKKAMVQIQKGQTIPGFEEAKK